MSIRWLRWLLLAACIGPATGLALVMLTSALRDSRVWLPITSQPLLVAGTFAYGATAALLGTGVGWAAAHVHFRYLVRARRMLHALTMASMLMPPFTFAMALVILFGQSGFLSSHVGVGSWSVYGFGGLVVSAALSHVPYAYAFLSLAYRRLNVGLLEAAQDLGAAPRTAMRRLALPQLRPALVGILLILFADSIADLAIPMVIGGGYSTLAPRIVQSVIGENDQAAAIGYGVLLTVPAVLAWGVSQRVAVQSRSTEATSIALARVRPQLGGRILTVLVWGAALISVVLMLSVAGAAFTSLAGRPTLQHFTALLAGPDRQALATTLLVALISAPLVTLIAFAHAAVPRASVLLGRVLALIGVVPGVVVGLAALLTMQVVTPVVRAAGLPEAAPTVLALGAMVTVHVIRLVPRVAASAGQLWGDALTPLWESSRDLGVAGPTAIGTVVLPRLLPPLLSGGLVTFARSITSVSGVILLTTSQAPLLSVRMLGEVDSGRVSSAAAMNVLMAAAILATGLVASVLRSAWDRTSTRTGAEVNP